MTETTEKTEAQTQKANQDLLWRGATLALVGAVVVLGPYVARSPSVVELLTGGRVVGWFSLVLGIAFLGQYFLRRHRAGR